MAARTFHARTFYAKRASFVPGDDSLELTHEWARLEPGTRVRPQHSGQNNVHGAHTRVVYVLSGPRAGQTIEGPF